MNTDRGLLISIEGVDTAGKSTQAILLKDRFEKEGKKATIIHFPRYESTVGSYIGKILNDENMFNNISKKALQMLYVADQLDAQEEIERLLSEGVNVILDRYDLSTIAYYSMLNKENIATAISDVYHNLQFDLKKPDITFLLTLESNEIAKRKKVLDNMEKLSNIKEITNLYIDIKNYIQDSRYFVYVYANMPIEKVHKEIYKYLANF